MTMIKNKTPDDIDDEMVDYVDDYFESDLTLPKDADNDVEKQRKIRRLLEERLEQKRLREEIDELDWEDDIDSDY